MFAEEADADWNMNMEQIKLWKIWLIISKNMSLPSFFFSLKELFVYSPAGPKIPAENSWPTDACTKEY